jgi:hypothetical protein
MKTCSGKPAAKVRLFDEHETFTHGGDFWRDDYLVGRWARSEKPVVYLGDVYNNFELKLRLGDWCWLTQEPVSRYGRWLCYARGSRDVVSAEISTRRDYLTIKFLSRPPLGEFVINQFVREHCRSPFVTTIQGSFKLPHHLAQTDPEYSGVEFDAVFYRLTGTDLCRLSLEPDPYDDDADEPTEPPCRPYVPLPSHRRKQCIRDLTLGLAALHRIGVVHGGRQAYLSLPFLQFRLD